MKKSMVYLCPQVQGEQDYVCWGMAQGDLTLAKKTAVKELILAGLDEVTQLGSWIAGRSFSVLMGENGGNFWIAVPRQIPVKVMKILDQQLRSSGLVLTHVLTSEKNRFDFYGVLHPVLSYDRGFIYDGSRIDVNQVQASFLAVACGN